MCSRSTALHGCSMSQEVARKNLGLEVVTGQGDLLAVPIGDADIDVVLSVFG